MEFVGVLGDFLKWFHFFGQSIYAPPALQVFWSNGTEHMQSSMRKCSYFPTAFLLIFTISVSTVLCLNSNFILDYAVSSGFKRILLTLLVLSLAILPINIFVAAGQTVFLQSHYEQMYAQIEVAEQLLRSRMVLHFQDLHRSLLRHTYIICGAYLLPYLAIVATKTLTSKNMLIMGCDVIMTYLTLTCYFHAIFFIRLLNYMLKTFVKYIEVRTLTIANAITFDSETSIVTLMSAEMFYYKLVHFNLWELSQVINQIFGWSLSVYLLEQFLYAIYVFFHLCIVGLEPINSKGLLRELSQQFLMQNN